ncbi:MAG: cation:proton antiporter [Thermoprotei archaeon]
MVVLPQISLPGPDGVLAAVGAVIILGSLAELAFIRYAVPESVGLMLLGMLMGPVLHVVPVADVDVFRSIAPVFGAVALVVIVFGGGIRLDPKSLGGVGKRGALLAVLDTVLTIAVVTPFAHFVMGWPLAVSALTGALLGETTAAVVIPVAQGLSLDQASVDTLTLNSTLNSITCILAFYILLDQLTGSSAGAGSLVGAAVYGARLLLVGLAIGGATGVVWVFVLEKIRRISFYRATLGLVFLLYAAADAVGSSAVLAVLVFAIIVGNYWVYLTDHEYEFPGGPSELGEQLTGVAFLDKEITFIVKMFFYVFIGLLVRPSLYAAELGLSISVLLLAARALGSAISLTGNEALSKHLGVFVALYPRGLTVSVLAGVLINTLTQPPLSVFAENIFNVAFMVIIFTTIISGGFLVLERLLSRKREIYRAVAW